jgi:hypothetical protein
MFWRKRTIYRLRQSELLSNPFTEAIFQTESKSWSEIRKRSRAAATDERTLRGAIESTMTGMLSEIENARDEIATASDAETIKVLEARMDTFRKVVSEKVMSFVKSMNRKPDAEQALDRACARESPKKAMRLDGALDPQASKLLARLVGLKEFKRMPAGGAGMSALEARPPA